MKTIAAVLIALFLIGIGYYFLYLVPSQKSKEGSPCDTKGGTNNDGTIKGGVCVKNSDNTLAPPAEGNAIINPSIKSYTVHESATTPAPNPVLFLNNITNANIGSFNIFTSAGSNFEFINFTTQFNKQCPQYVWYKHWLYSFVASTTDANTGNKTCYYKVDKSVFPTELKIQTPNSQCSNFKFYTSGVEYKFLEIRVETPNPLSTPITYCVYTKQ